MVMNPRGPKIRHLNASNPLLIELEANVQKVQVILQTIIASCVVSQKDSSIFNVFSGIRIQSAGARETTADEGTAEEAAGVSRESQRDEDQSGDSGHHC